MGRLIEAPRSERAGMSIPRFYYITYYTRKKKNQTCGKMFLTTRRDVVWVTYDKGRYLPLIATPMSPASKPAGELVPAGQNLPSSLPSQLPDIVHRASQATVFAAEEFFYGRIRKEHTRAAYLIAVRRFL